MTKKPLPVRNSTATVLSYVPSGNVIYVGTPTIWCYLPLSLGGGGRKSVNMLLAQGHNDGASAAGNELECSSDPRELDEHSFGIWERFVSRFAKRGSLYTASSEVGDETRFLFPLRAALVYQEVQYNTKHVSPANCPQRLAQCAIQLFFSW